MPNLIVDEDGERRAFKLGEGRLTIGSGEDAKLKLRSAGVAALHADLEIRSDGVVLRSRPGVQPPTIGGRPAPAEARLLPGQAVQIGSASLMIEVPGAGGGAPGGRRGPAAGIKTSGRRSVVQRRRNSGKKGLPTWATVGLLLGMAGLGVFLVSESFSSAASGMQDVDSRMASIRGEISRDNYDKAATLLDELEADDDLSAKELATVGAFAKEMRSELQDAFASRRNVEGTRWHEQFIEKYDSRYLQNEPAHAKIRTFLRLCAEFKENYPGHPEMASVDAQAAAWSRYASLDDDPSYDDIAWDIKYTLNRKPRDYATAFRILRDYEKLCEGDGCSKARDLRDTLEEERLEYHKDRLQEARYEFEHKDNAGMAAMWLISSITMLGEPELQDEAAGFYVLMPNFESTMLGMQRDQPERFENVLKNGVVRKRARELGLVK